MVVLSLSKHLILWCYRKWQPRSYLRPSGHHLWQNCIMVVADLTSLFQVSLHICIRMDIPKWTSDIHIHTHITMYIGNVYEHIEIQSWTNVIYIYTYNIQCTLTMYMNTFRNCHGLMSYTFTTFTHPSEILIHIFIFIYT